MSAMSFQLVVVNRRSHVGARTNTGQVDQAVNTSSLERLRVTDTRSLENQGRGESSSRHNNLLASAECARLGWTSAEGLGWNNLNSDSPAILKNDLVDLGASGKVQVAVHCTSRVDI